MTSVSRCRRISFTPRPQFVLVIVTPVLYAIFYGIHEPAAEAAGSQRLNSGDDLK